MINDEVEEIRKKLQEETIANIKLAKPFLEQDLFKFNKYVLKVDEGKGKALLTDFHKEMCDFVMRRRKQRKKLILVPRSHLKSTVITIGRSLQAIVTDPSVRILIANATYDLACSFLTEIKRHLKYNRNIHMFWGDLTKDTETWSKNDITLNYAKMQRGKKEPTVTAMGIESNMTSQHYDIIILDDLINKDYVNTREQIDKTINFYKECLNLLEPNGELIVIGTRWRDDDLYGWIMDSDNNVISDFDVYIRKAYDGDLYGEDFKAIFPQKFSQDHLKRLYEQQGPYFFCTPAESPILMADFTTKPISQVIKGDEVVGFYRGEGNKNGKLVRNRVKAVSTHLDYVCDFKMGSGRTVRCTADHKWYSRKKDETHRIYKPARVGTKLGFICEPTKEISVEERLLWNYLAGFFDGDGTAKSGAKMLFTQSATHNKTVYDKVIEVINRLGLKHGEFIRNNSDNMIWINDSRQAVVDMIRYADFGKRQQLVDRLYRQGAKFIKEYDKVLDISKGKNKELVYGLETETGNYVVWGYASSNSTQYLNDPISPEDAVFKKEWFRYYEPLELEGMLLNHFTSVDPAISLEKDADYTAIVTVSIDQFSNIYVRDIRRARMKPSDIIEWIFKIWEQYHPIEIALEDVAYQKALQYSLSEEMRRRQVYLPIKQVKPANRSKDQRIKGLQPLYYNGKILHTRITPCLVHLEDELMRFPMGKHDDTVDALSYMLDIVYPPVRKVSRRQKHHYLYHS